MADDPVVEGDPERDEREDQRDRPARDRPLGEDHGAVAAGDQQRADDERRPPLGPAHRIAAHVARRIVIASSTLPAITNRVPAAISGGRVSFVTCDPR